MESSIKRIIIAIFFIYGLLIVTTIYSVYNSQEEKQNEEPAKFTPLHYKSLAVLGLVPTTESRDLNKNDYDTGLRVSHQGNIYALMESRGINESDFGKTFLFKTN